MGRNGRSNMDDSGYIMILRGVLDVWFIVRKRKVIENVGKGE